MWVEGEEWDLDISPKRKWYELKLREVVQYKDLILLLVKRSFAAQYKQTILGPLWFIINPLLSSFVSTIIFGNIAKIATDGVPYFLFYICGYTLWNYFSTCVSTTASTFTANANIMGKVYFPRLTMPISSVLFAAINMLIVFAMSIIAMVVYRLLGYNIMPHFELVALIPVLMVQTALLSLGVGIIISSLTTKYRDLALLVGFGLNLWMYITPVVYPMSAVKGALRTAILVNPMSPIIQNYKYIMLGSGEFEFISWVVSLCATFIILLLGILLFNKIEKNFMDTV